MTKPFARAFRIHTTDGRTLDGAQLPSGRCFAEDVEDARTGHGSIVAAVSIAELLHMYPDADMEWATTNP